MNEIKTRGFASISTPDGRFRLWMQRPRVSGTILINCGFSLKERMAFVDAIDALSCVEVTSVRNVDQDYSSITLACHGLTPKCAERLLEALPDLMQQHLVAAEEGGQL
ncbi:MAG: hypothetical protein Q4D56_06555 [Bacteroides sp.]|nr:hypothetical protein [Bacteroides sp.]